MENVADFVCRERLFVKQSQSFVLQEQMEAVIPPVTVTVHLRLPPQAKYKQYF